MTIGERLKAWREKKGITQQDAAGIFKVCLKTINNWEAGRTKPPDMIEKIIK